MIRKLKIMSENMAIELPNSQQRFNKGIGLTQMLVTQSNDQQNEYDVYAKGYMDMGSFINLMERVEYIGKEMVYK